MGLRFSVPDACDISTCIHGPLLAAGSKHCVADPVGLASTAPELKAHDASPERHEQRALARFHDPVVLHLRPEPAFVEAGAGRRKLIVTTGVSASGGRDRRGNTQGAGGVSSHPSRLPAPRIGLMTAAELAIRKR